MSPTPPDFTLQLGQALIRCASVTPTDAGAMHVVQTSLQEIGFHCQVYSFGDGQEAVSNLYATYGQGPFHLAFAGHVDVVPVGDAAGWSVDPFGGEIKRGCLYGRGAVDMKGAIAAYIGALRAILPSLDPSRVKLSLLLTGDEEGPAVHGTVQLLQVLKAQGEVPDYCLIGEPTSKERVGDTLKIGRRGSLNATLLTRGQQGHVAYPHLADNPLHRLVPLLHTLMAHSLDEGTEAFPPSCLQVTSIDVGNPTSNVIPAQARAQVNIRFNPLHTGVSLGQWLQAQAAPHQTTVTYRVSGEAFQTRPHSFQTTIEHAIQHVCGQPASLSTDGGTSDGRFIQEVCAVSELGLRHTLAHQVDEHVPLADLALLQQIYETILSAVGSQ